jgi:hypothetical protein
LFRIATASIVLAAVTIAAMSWLPRRSTLTITLISEVLNGVLCIAFIRRLPPVALAKIRGLIRYRF